MEAKRNLGGRKFSFQQVGPDLMARDLTATQAVREASLDYEIERRDLYFETREEKDLGHGNKSYSYPKFRIPGKVALTREGKQGEKFLGIVGSDYTVLSNLEIASHVDRLLPHLPVSTISDRGGRGLFIAVRLGETTIAMDKLEEYLLISDYRDGKNALRVSYFAGRLACHNGLLTAATTRWAVSINHNKLISPKFTDILASVNKKRFEAVTSLERLAALYPTKGPSRETLLDRIYPAPKEPSGLDGNPAREMIEKAFERDRQAASNARSAVAGLILDTASEYGDYAYTGYHLLNEVAEYEQHVRPGRSPVSVGFSSTFGERAATLERTHNLLSSL